MTARTPPQQAETLQSLAGLRGAEQHTQAVEQAVLAVVALKREARISGALVAMPAADWTWGRGEEKPEGLEATIRAVVKMVQVARKEKI